MFVARAALLQRCGAVTSRTSGAVKPGTTRGEFAARGGDKHRRRDNSAPTLRDFSLCIFFQNYGKVRTTGAEVAEHPSLSSTVTV
jgi:hypothetical protein